MSIEMDAEKAALCKRRSSILKTVKRNTDDERTDEIATQRRVSFANKYAVKPFTHDAEANTIWDATYEELAVHSDQSTCHSNADSASHMSIEVSNMNCSAKYMMQSSGRSKSVMNAPCVHLDEDMEIETEEVHFAPVFQTSKPKPKFGIYVEDCSNLANDNSISDDYFLKPSLLKENIRANFNLRNVIRIDSENDVMDITRSLVSNEKVAIEEEGNMEFTSLIPTNALKDETIEDGNMEFTTAIPTQLLLEKFRRIKDVNSHMEVMDITRNVLTNKVKVIAEADMELASPISKKIALKRVPRNVLNSEDSMQFTMNLPAHLLQKLRLRNLESERCDKDNMDITSNSQETKCDNTKVSTKQCDMELETYAKLGIQQIIVPNEPDLIKRISTARRGSSLSPFDGSLHTNPASEVDDTQYLINYKSQISEGTPIGTSEPGKVKSLMNVEDICKPKHKIGILSVDEIPKIVEVIPPVSQSCENMGNINEPVKAKEICLEAPGTLDVQKDSNKISIKSNEESRNQSLQCIKATIDKLIHSEINVFKPSSRNNTQLSFLGEPMELGTTTVIDESIESVKKTSEEPNLGVKCRETDKIIFALVPETTKVSEIIRTNCNELQLKEATIQTDQVLRAMAKENIPLTVNCHEIDKIIFTTESANSLELEDAPIQAIGTLRQSYGIAEEYHVTTNMPTQEILATTIHSLEKNCLASICQAAKPIPDDSLDVINVDDEDGEVIENISESSIALYDSDGESKKLAEAESLKSSSLSADNVTINTEDLVTVASPNKPVPLSYLDSFPVNCSASQWYDLLGVPAEDRPKELPPKMSTEEKEKQRVARELKKQAIKQLFERLAQKERKMEETIAQMEQEDAEDAEEELMKNFPQGRTVRLLTIDEWLRQQKKLQSTLWQLSSNKCVVSARSVQFTLEMDSESYVITNILVQNVAADKSELRQFISKLIVDKMQLSQIHGAIGSKYNLRTFLEYLQLKLEDVVAIEREFMDIFGRVLVETQLYFDDNFNLQYLLIGRSRWLIEINCSDINKLSVSALTSFSTLCGDIKVPERQIKKIAKKCPTGLPFLSSFIDAVYEFRNVRERQYCKELNELLIRMDRRIAEHKN